MNQRIRMTVRYDGTGFSGSQIQPGQRTVAGTLTECLRSILDQDVHLLWASRTDSGVHADGNVCVFDAQPGIPVDKLAEITNPRLPADLMVRDSMEVDPEFHPRFDATSRTYLYRIYRSKNIPVDRYRYCADWCGEWNALAVEQALNCLAGKHSFNFFCQGVEDPKDAVCNLQPVCEIENGAEICWSFTADRFLRHMICRLAGVVFAAASSRIAPEQIAAGLIKPLDFRYVPAPARGLTLRQVEYGTRLTGTDRI